MWNHLSCWMSLITLGLHLACTAGAATVTVTLAPAAGSYLASEPIALNLLVTNQGPNSIYFESNYPLFPYRSHVGITLNSAPGQVHGLGPALIRMYESVPLIPIAPGKSKIEKVFLQRYMHDLAPGTHRITYSAHISYRLVSDRRVEDVAIGEGTFEVVVLGGGDEELARALKKHAESPWLREALCVTNSPLVIPHVERLAEMEPEQTLNCLSKFRGDSSVETFVRRYLHHERPNTVSAALEVLETWHLSLPVAEFEQLFKRPEFSVKSATLHYAGELRDRSYLPAVRAQASSPNPGIAEYARKVEKLLVEDR